MSKQNFDESADELVYHVKTLVWSGFKDENEIEESSWECVEEEWFEETEITTLEQLRKLIKDLFAAKSEEEKTWPAETDNDRLIKAFEELTASGIIALENAGYTMSDGWSDFQEVAHSKWVPAGLKDKIRGGCFYHGQDLERAVDGGELCIAFGATSGEDPDSLEIAKEVVEVLTKHGFAPSWNGTVDERIFLPINWQRRLGPPANTSPPAVLRKSGIAKLL